MTKMKSKKMTKSTFAIIIMAVLMVAMLAFGGTYAYFTATTNDTLNGSAKTGTLKITPGDEIAVTVTEQLVPNRVLKTINTNDIALDGSTVAAFRVKLEIGAIYKGTNLSDDISSTLTDKATMITLDIADKFEAGAVSYIKTPANAGEAATALEWYKDGNYIYCNQVKASTEDATVSFADIAPVISVKLAAEADNDYQDLTINFTFQIEAVQAEYTDGSYTTAIEANDYLSLNALKALPWGNQTPGVGV